MKVSQQEIRAKANEILQGCYSLAPDKTDALNRVRFTLSRRMTNAAGRAYSTGEVKLSLAFFSDRNNFENDFHETVTHEIAHVLAPSYREPGKRRQPHGPAWKAMHRRLGGTGARCHTMALADGYTRRARRARVEATCGCGCGTPITLGPTQAKRAQSGTRYFLKGHRPKQRPSDPFGGLFNI